LDRLHAGWRARGRSRSLGCNRPRLSKGELWRPTAVGPCAAGWIVGPVCLYGTEDLFDRIWRSWRGPEWLRPATGGLLLGLLLLVLPQMYGVGYPVIERAIGGTLPFSLLVGKIIATSVTNGMGGSGGVPDAEPRHEPIGDVTCGTVVVVAAEGDREPEDQISEEDCAETGSDPDRQGEQGQPSGAAPGSSRRASLRSAESRGRARTHVTSMFGGLSRRAPSESIARCSGRRGSNSRTPLPAHRRA